MIQPRSARLYFKKKAAYLPIRVKTAAPSARIPTIIGGIAMNTERP